MKECCMRKGIYPACHYRSRFMVMNAESMWLGNYTLTHCAVSSSLSHTLVCPQHDSRNSNRAISDSNDSIVLWINSVGNQEINGIECACLILMSATARNICLLSQPIHCLLGGSCMFSSISCWMTLLENVAFKHHSCRSNFLVPSVWLAARVIFLFPQYDSTCLDCLEDGLKVFSNLLDHLKGLSSGYCANALETGSHDRVSCNFLPLFLYF